MKKRIRIGVDTGGTFTDFVIISNGRVQIKKIPSTPQNPSLAVLKGLSEFLTIPESLHIVHGTTVATNTLLERKGGRIALITTSGFEDVLFIGRQTRQNLYSLKGEERQNLLPRSHCIGLEERTAPGGRIEKKVSQAAMKKAIQNIKQIRPEAVAVSFLHSYANPDNEQAVYKKLQELGLLASISSSLLPEYREYERTTVAVVNAYLMPVLSKYLENLENALCQTELYIMQSNEGYISPSAAREEPIRTALSGPAGGVVGTFHLGKAAGFRNLISFDMGGTSCDVSLVSGCIGRTNESSIGGFPIRLPLIDIHTVGAGGGSIAFVDIGGSLRVGPKSAGADPGPACYGRGSYPTVTDANLVLGRLVPEFFLGGKMSIDPERSRQALVKLASKINKSLLETAEGIIEIANASMEKAIRVISIERGHDPRSFALFSFGGAGGLHAAEISSNLNIAKVIVPNNAGVLSALGLLLADSIKDYSKSVLKTVDKNVFKELKEQFQKLWEKGLEDMRSEGFDLKNIRLFSSLDLRYFGQSYEINIPYRKDMSFVKAFHREHRKHYSYFHPETPVEIVAIRVKAVGTGEKVKLKKYLSSGSRPEQALLKRQDLIFKGKRHHAPVYLRSQLEPGHSIDGPALVVDEESTTFLPPGFALKIDAFLNLILQK